jgi:aminoglycoside/choline kinase family phosphotransferase
VSSQAGIPDDRFEAMLAWLADIGRLNGAEPRPASADASFRRYFRVRSAEGSLIVMDAPPALEDSMPFVRVAGFLEAMRLNAPRILEADLDKGFLLMTDLGSTQYLDALRADPALAAALYRDALDALARLQSRGIAYQGSLPPYDEPLLRFELSLFHDWLCGTHLGIDFGAAEEAAWRRTCDLLVQNALDQPRVFVHRDYHSRNLMVASADNPGILDFQDAVEGPLTYDLVSLLKDCYVCWPAERVHDWAAGYYGMLDAGLRRQVDEALFLRYFELMGVQRHLKAAGIFARLNHRDHKPGYMADVPRTLDYIVELGPRYPELEPLVDLIVSRCLPKLRGQV